MGVYHHAHRHRYKAYRHKAGVGTDDKQRGQQHEYDTDAAHQQGFAFDVRVLFTDQVHAHGGQQQHHQQGADIQRRVKAARHHAQDLQHGKLVLRDLLARFYDDLSFFVYHRRYIVFRLIAGFLGGVLIIQKVGV